jgi:hypothetical protein
VYHRQEAKVLECLVLDRPGQHLPTYLSQDITNGMCSTLTYMAITGPTKGILVCIALRFITFVEPPQA